MKDTGKFPGGSVNLKVLRHVGLSNERGEKEREHGGGNESSIFSVAF